MNCDGTVVVYTGTTDVGQGSDTYLAQIAGETLGVGMEDIRVISSDTLYAPFDEGAGSSRVMFVVGRGVKDACDVARKRLLEAAALMLGLPKAARLYTREGEIFYDTYPDIRTTVREAARYAQMTLGAPIQGEATFTTISTSPQGEDGHALMFEKHIFATHMAEVEVDTDTGVVRVTKYVAVTDCGRAVNPLLLEGQQEGGVGQGIGYALMEELLEDPQSGRLLTDTFSDYHIPTVSDMPEVLITDSVEIPDEDGAYGAKGASEPASAPTAPAIANAIADAVGVRFDTLPITPERVLLALLDKEL
jgi:CO/xanthine dehydrogenase Mo-binding subunit